ncbi:MAG: hypothetical protein HN337_09590 [Deltaproteobacteria bacterium]|jgi:hypothetical protein|nr:hypothetical protein [Deltaproteobacteria bacterium]
MKKLLIAVLAVAVATTFALTAMAGEAKVKSKETVKKDGTTKEEVVVKEKGVGKAKMTATATPAGDVKVHDVTKFKHGDLWKDDVKFQKYDKDGNFIYVINDNKTYRVKMKKNAKSPGLVLKKGQPISITSTYPLAGPELQDYIVVSKIEQATK